MGRGLGSAVGRGHEPPDSLVVLAFGMPQHYRGRFGVSVFGGRFANSTGAEASATRLGIRSGSCGAR